MQGWASRFCVHLRVSREKRERGNRNEKEEPSRKHALELAGWKQMIEMKPEKDCPSATLNEPDVQPQASHSQCMYGCWEQQLDNL